MTTGEFTERLRQS